ncbi:MAG TPA: DMT family transporter [Burkholderiales bacterium]|nr:DMT family transporter [Burkholderiales bacterium]
MTAPPGVAPPHVLRGILLLVTAVSTFALLDAMTKYLARTYPVPMIVWARYATQTLMMVLVLGPRLGYDLVRSRRPGLQVIRGVVLVGSSMFFVYALAHLPLAEASAIGFLSPLVLAGMSVWLLAERVRRSVWAAIIAGFVGVLFIVRPGGDVFTAAAVLPMLSAVCFAGYQLLTRQLAGIDSSLTTLFYGAIVGAVLLTFALPFSWQPPASVLHGLAFCLLGILGGTGHFLLIRAFTHAPPSVLAPFVYAQLVAVLALGYLVFGEFPDRGSLVGMAIIVLAGAWIAARQAR